MRSRLTVHLVHRFFLSYMRELPISLDQPKSLDGVIQQCTWLRIFDSGLQGGSEVQSRIAGA